MDVYEIRYSLHPAKRTAISSLRKRKIEEIASVTFFTSTQETGIQPAIFTLCR